MAMNFRMCFAALLTLTLATQAKAADVKVTVNNPLAMQRQELIEVPFDEVKKKLGMGEGDSLVVKNAMQQQVPYQLTSDGKILIEVAVKPKGQTQFSISKGSPEPMTCYVQGRYYAIRKDDIAWENERGAYRVYGPALQKSGERSFGIDVWTKNSPELNLPHRFYLDAEGQGRRAENKANKELVKDILLHTSFHYDQGKGLDCYGVGPTLGCGTPALMVGDSLVMPYSYEKYKIVENGPLRFKVELTYGTKMFKGSKVTEHRVISLDKGSNFNEMKVWYTGLPSPTDVATGVVIHEKDPDEVTLSSNFVLYADPTEQPNKYGFSIYVGCIFPEDLKAKMLPMRKPEAGAVAHAIGVKKELKDGEPFTYYFGSAWSSYDVRTFGEWNLIAYNWLAAKQHPLVVSLQ